MTAADLGLHAVPRGLVATQVVLAAVTIAVCRSVGLGVGGDAAGWFSQLAAPVMLLVLWMAHYVQPGRKSSEWWIAEAALGLGLLGVGTIVLFSAQYAAVAINRPPIDASLAAADAYVGISVPALVAWTKAQPWAADIMFYAYFSLVPQLILVTCIIWWTRDRQVLWEYVVTYHMCAVVAVLASAMWPVEGAFTYYGFTSTLNQARFMEHFYALRDGRMTVIPFGYLEGLISMPSFHVIGGLLLATAVRRTRLFIPAAILNGLLIVSTVMTGAHYAVDVAGGVLVWGAAVLVHRRYIAPLIPDISASDCTAAADADSELSLPGPREAAGPAVQYLPLLRDVGTAEESGSLQS